jgi:hypothetical protein
MTLCQFSDKAEPRVRYPHPYILVLKNKGPKSKSKEFYSQHSHKLSFGVQSGSGMSLMRSPFRTGKDVLIVIFA